MRKKTTISPKLVGQSFVKQYYEHLSQDTHNLYRFYKDESTFTHGEGSQPEPAVSGMANIKDKISSLGLSEAQVQLEKGSVDAQRSKDGGVLLMVTGTMIVKTNNKTKPRLFVQTFFLAPQHQKSEQMSYFVLNDTFRFMEPLNEVAAEAKAGVHANGDAAVDQAAHSAEQGDSLRGSDVEVGSSEAADGGVMTQEASDVACDGDAEPKGGAGTLSWASLVKKGPSSGAVAAPSQARVASKTAEDVPSGWGDEDDEGAAVAPSQARVAAKAAGGDQEVSAPPAGKAADAAGRRRRAPATRDNRTRARDATPRGVDV